MSKLADIAYSYVGKCAEGSAAHRQLIQDYNSIKPVPRGYKVSTRDPWCAIFATVCMDKAGVTNAPRECSADKMLHKCKTLVTTPQPGNLIFYDWNKNGTADHVGIIHNVTGQTLEVVEGNYNNRVRLRYINIGNGSIYRYARVESVDLESVARDVIRGKYGNGDARKKALTAAGYDYDAVQALVNEKLKK